jgi:hypothetical protein
VSRLVSLYPRGWRSRYEDEFRALIDERPPTLIERFDIVRSAFDAHLHPQVPGSTEREPEPPVPDADLLVARRLGLGAVAGAAAWIAAFAVASIGPIRYDGDGAYRDGGAAFPLLFLAVVLLSAGLVGQLIALPRSARLARLGAGLAIPFLLLWGLGPWMLPLGLVALVGLIALAVGGYRSGGWSTVPSVAVVACCLAVVGITWFAAATIDGDRMAGGTFLLLAAAALVPAWLGVGATLIRRPG